MLGTLMEREMLTKESNVTDLGETVVLWSQSVFAVRLMRDECGCSTYPSSGAVCDIVGLQWSVSLG